MPECTFLWIIEHHNSKISYTTFKISARKIICNYFRFLKSTIFKKKHRKETIPPYFQSTSINNTFCCVFTIKKPSSLHKIGRFLGIVWKHVLSYKVKKHLKLIFFTFLKWLHRVERTRKHLEKLVWSIIDRDSIKICKLKITVKFFVIQALM